MGANSSGFRDLDLRLEDFLVVSMGLLVCSFWEGGGGGGIEGPRPTRMSPAVRVEGANGPMRRERANQKMRDLKGSDSR